jgi:predicted ATP-dependent Lon-type protease
LNGLIGGYFLFARKTYEFFINRPPLFIKLWTWMLCRANFKDLSIQGNIKAVQSLVEPLQMAMENGARRALIPLENKRNFLEVSGEIIETVDPIFYSDPQTAAMKALSLK